MSETRKSGNTHVEFPDAVKVENDGSVLTFCWRDDERVCTGGCEAFDPQYANDETAAFTACRILNLGIAVGAALSRFLHSNTLSKSASVPRMNIKPPEVS